MSQHSSSRPTSFLSDSSSSIWSRFSTLFHRRRSKYHHRRRPKLGTSLCTNSSTSCSSITQSSGSITLSSSSTTAPDDSLYESSTTCPTSLVTPTVTKDATDINTNAPITTTRNSLFAIPPYSPTYCKENEFPYSNFYVKLPDGRYMIRYRSGNREILGTEIIEGYMI
ncbi:hypothetical protein BDA99DRAFT_535016 [Phascolomyces articulosus]|uniref:Uncharacterized protein n=1 Tax=Phascolomyces articulosus TaxID=60185 RepID=A0AAD5PHR1_9FUNG|nr:hypothetical protein BDA99DRAFT_535016 [Phascolomyces articulosus]